MAYNGFAIDTYLDAAAVTRQLDQLIDSYLRRVSLADLLQGRLPQDLPCPQPKTGQVETTVCKCGE